MSAATCTHTDATTFPLTSAVKQTQTVLYSLGGNGFVSFTVSYIKTQRSSPSAEFSLTRYKTLINYIKRLQVNVPH